MIYYLFEYLEQFDFPGAGIFQYLSSRASFAAITSLVISMIFGKKIIKVLHRKQIGELVRDLGLDGQKQKAQEIKVEIERIEAQINQMVYKLYGLTEEEIRTVESSL